MALRLILAAALALLAAPAPAPARPCTATLCNAEALAPIFDKLRTPGAAIHILQIGDSHTAGDMVSGAWRRRLQAHFGNGGRGVLAPGRPYAGYLTWQVTATQTPGWQVDATFGSFHLHNGRALGLSGFTQTASLYGEIMWLNADTPDDWFDRLVVCAIAGPGAGSVVLQAGDVMQGWTLDAAAEAPECQIVDSPAPALRAAVYTATDGAAVSITSWAVFRRSGGAVLSSLGVSGSQLAHLSRTSDAVDAAELAAWRPDLIVLAFGTNEGFSPVRTAEEAEAALRTQVARLRRLAGRDVPILLLGAPDAATRTPIGTPRLSCGAGWYVPALLEQVRARQAETARALGLAYWDWAAAMGGRCASTRWVASGDMRGDHVHFTRGGGERIGAMLDAAFTRAVEASH